MSKRTLFLLTTLSFNFTDVNAQPVVEPDSYVEDGKPSIIEFTCSDSLKKGEILAWYQTKDLFTKDSGVVNFETNKYTHFSPVSGKSLHFKVRASNDAHIGLCTKPENSEPVYNIIFGGGGNTFSVIRLNYKTIVLNVPTPEILKKTEFRGFWVSWDKGLISLGHEGNDTAFGSWQDPKPFVVSYYGLNTCHNCNGTWKIKGRTWMSEDKLLKATQVQDEEQSVELTLTKTLEHFDNNTSVYCAKQNEDFTYLGLESTRIPIIFQNIIPPLDETCLAGKCLPTWTALSVLIAVVLAITVTSIVSIVCARKASRMQTNEE